MATVKAAFSPKGTRIIGTLEHIEGRADVSEVWREEGPDGLVVGVEYSGSTEVMR